MEGFTTPRGLGSLCYVLTILAVPIIFVAGCRPEVEELVPNTARVGEWIEIHGEGFGAVQGESIVTLGGIPIEEVDMWTEDVIRFSIPPEARTSEVRVVKVLPSNSLLFTLEFDEYEGGCMEVEISVEDDCFPYWPVEYAFAVVSEYIGPFFVYCPGYDELPYPLEFEIPNGIGSLAATVVLGPDGFSMVSEEPAPATLDLSGINDISIIDFACLIHGTVEGSVIPTSPTTAMGEFFMTDISTEEVEPGGCHGFTPVSEECTMIFRADGLRRADECD